MAGNQEGFSFKTEGVRVEDIDKAFRDKLQTWWTRAIEDLYTNDEAEDLLDGEDPCAFAVRLLDA